MPLAEPMRIVAEQMQAYLAASDYLAGMTSTDLRDAILSYPQAGGKFLRPCLLLWSCRALGGNETHALPAALAVELFHTWTLVHDDIIDRDPTRRGRPTVHEEFRLRGQKQFAFGDSAPHYGQSMAILAGDVQHGWAVSLLAQIAEKGADPALALALIRDLESQVLPRLIEGEVLDVQLAHRPLSDITEADIMRVIGGKTAALFSFAARAGARIAKADGIENDPSVQALGDFGYNTGLAFQLQDDILGIIGNPAKMGKPVGSDIREAKRTLPLLYAWQQAPAETRKRLESLIGRADTTPAEIGEASRMLIDLGGIAYAQEIAQQYLDTALQCLEIIPSSIAKELLEAFAVITLERAK
jgi:geranylgeranyl diphosphate synthase, type I